MTAPAGVAAAADEGVSSAVRGDAAEAQAAIVIVGREPGAREILHRELSKRYGEDYQIVACGRPPLPLETSLPGVFAAGDVRQGSVKRVASAVGEGAATIPLVHRYLQTTAAALAAVSG
jgi:thioredoxin reductase